jgi:spermidine/putrescine transport system substrate-binding protein
MLNVTLMSKAFSRRRLLFVILIWLLIPMPGSLAAAQNRLNLFIWSEYIDPAIVADFEKQFDCKVVIDLYEDEAAMMAKLQGGGASLYDVVVPPDHKVPALIKLNLLAPLRHDHVPNLKNLDPKFCDPPYDRGNRYTVAYQWGTVGLYVRPPAGILLTNTWGLIFDPKLQPGPFVLIDSARDVIGAALKYQGHSLNSTDLAHLKEARDVILSARQRCIGFDGSVAGKNKVLNKTARVAMVYSGEAARGLAEDKQTVYLIPKEGSQIWQDNLAILAKAPHRDLAEKFINFLLDAEIGARISNFTQFATPNRAARPFIKPADLKNPAIYPPPEVITRLEFLDDLGTKSRLYDELWTQIKAR